MEGGVSAASTSGQECEAGSQPKEGHSQLACPAGLEAHAGSTAPRSRQPARGGARSGAEWHGKDGGHPRLGPYPILTRPPDCPCLQQEPARPLLQAPEAAPLLEHPLVTQGLATQPLSGCLPDISCWTVAAHAPVPPPVPSPSPAIQEAPTMRKLACLLCKELG